MSDELILLGTAGGPAPVAGRAGIASALRVNGRIYLVDCGRGTPTGFVNAGLDFAEVDAVFLTHLHADHTGDLPGLLVYGWGLRTGQSGPLPPIDIHGPGRPDTLPDSDGPFRRHGLIRPELPAPGTADLVHGIVDAFAYHFNIMPLDSDMPDPAALARGHDIGATDRPVTVFEDDHVCVTAVSVAHGHAHPSLAYKFRTPTGTIVFSGDTRPDDRLRQLAAGADILVHEVVNLDHLRGSGTPEPVLDRMGALHTDVHDVGRLAEEAGVGMLVLTHFIPADPTAVAPDRWRDAVSMHYSGNLLVGADGVRHPLGAR